MDEGDEKRRRLAESLRAIVTSRERTPRNPRWAAAWRRTLFRYVDELRRLESSKDKDSFGGEE